MNLIAEHSIWLALQLPDTLLSTYSAPLNDAASISETSSYYKLY